MELVETSVRALMAARVPEAEGLRIARAGEQGDVRVGPEPWQVTKRVPWEEGIAWGLWDGAGGLRGMAFNPEDLDPDADEAEERGSCRCYAAPVLLHPMPARGTFLLHEHWSEMLVHNEVTARVVRAGLSPHFVRSDRAAHDLAAGRSVQIHERCDVVLEKYFPHLPPQHLGCVLGQVLAGLAVAQGAVGLRHNDLHGSNIMVQWLRAPRGGPDADADGDGGAADRDPRWRGQRLAPARWFGYRLSETEALVLPNHGYLCKITDFGYASARLGGPAGPRIAPAGLHLYRTKSYGDFTEPLEGARGADAQTLVGYFLMQFKRLAPGQKPILRSLLTALGGTVTKGVGRPRRASDVPPLEILRTHPLFARFRCTVPTAEARPRLVWLQPEAPQDPPSAPEPLETLEQALRASYGGVPPVDETSGAASGAGGGAGGGAMASGADARSLAASRSESAMPADTRVSTV